MIVSGLTGTLSSTLAEPSPWASRTGPRPGEAPLDGFRECTQRLNSFPLIEMSLHRPMFDMAQTMKTVMLDFKQEIIVLEGFRTPSELKWLDQIRSSIGHW